MPPPSEEEIAPKKFTEATTRMTYKTSTIDLIDADFDEQGKDDNDDAEQLTLQKLLTRQYNSEADLRGRGENEAASLVRSLSDGLLARKRAKAYLNGDDEYEFLKIDSNYNQAIEEVCKLFTCLLKKVRSSS